MKLQIDRDCSRSRWIASRVGPIFFARIGFAWQRGRRSQRLCLFTGGLLLIHSLILESAKSDDFSTKSRFVQTLSAPMTSIVDGKPFRDGLMGIATQAGVNLWLDRRVDPSIPINAGPVGPTVFAAIDKLAESNGCVAMPIANVVLVGREAWVDQTAASILVLPANKRGEPINVTWDDLTTPTDALKSVAKESQPSLPQLPHDLWPAVRWKGIYRGVAITLVESQFHSIQRDPGSKSAHTRRYFPADVALPVIREAMRGADSKSRVRVSGDWAVAIGSAGAHRAASTALLAASRNVAGPDPDRDTFTLKKLTTSAENALIQLARSANKTCVIKPEAREACQAMISVEGVDLTLRRLIDMVATQAGVVATWQGDSIVISVR